MSDQLTIGPYVRDPDCPSCMGRSSRHPSWDVHEALRLVNEGKVSRYGIAALVGRKPPTVASSLRHHSRKISEGVPPDPTSGGGKKRFSMDSIKASVQAAYDRFKTEPQEHDWFSTRDYDRYKVPGDPSPVTIVALYSRWTDLCNDLGIPYRAPAARVRYTQVDEEDCYDSVVKFIHERMALIGNGRRTLGTGKYEKWAVGRDDVLSLATIQRRSGWVKLKERAIKEYEKHHLLMGDGTDETDPESYRDHCVCGQWDGEGSYMDHLRAARKGQE